MCPSVSAGRCHFFRSERVSVRYDLLDQTFIGRDDEEKA